MTLEMLGRAWKIQLLSSSEKLLALAIADQADGGPWHGNLAQLALKTSLSELEVSVILNRRPFQTAMLSIGVYPIIAE